MRERRRNERNSVLRERETASNVCVSLTYMMFPTILTGDFFETNPRMLVLFLNWSLGEWVASFAEKTLF